ncbi:hypothetical protein RM780_06085 [Streptomyces sp. DSM 44917]|uniref:Integral membrane protein n=1 Tax=Streptomyces boetiae TaxID=3075541 RepID=A0ABU2L4P7_9ACTN|nr:hypothetical protein [Streptomyces sp. DSM 44917]MDT0306528.1 hypothetical protein [Streptomyces sp. DSM 44917]
MSALTAAPGRTAAPATDRAGATAALRRWLTIDALLTGANALAYVVASGPIGRLLGLETALVAGTGAFLLLFTAGLVLLARSPRPPVRAVGAVIEANAAWALLGLAAPLLLLEPSTAGAVWIPAQGLVVGALAALQFGALRAMRRARG